MKLPELKEADKYTGLYVVDFGDRSSTGFTGREVSELLESEQFADAQVYKIVRAQPDGSLELKGVPSEIFQSEMGMFFYAADEQTARDDYSRLVTWANKQSAPARAKVHLAADGDVFVTALIYPAEYDDAFSRWLLDGNYRTSGAVQGGAGPVQSYYQRFDVLERTQLWPAESADVLEGSALLEATNNAIVR
ncbi:MAG: hypothetical protein ACYSUT_12065 [Planctomycetota bacterium]|jgi:hypothetical protein